MGKRILSSDSNKEKFCDLAAANREIRRLNAELRSKRLVEQKLAEAENRYRMLFEQAADVILIFNPINTRLVDFNKKAVEELGYAPDSMGQKKLEDLEAKENSREIRKHIKKIIDQGSDTFETLLSTKDKGPRHFWVNACAIKIGGAYYIQTIARDITERKKKETALRKLSDNIIEMNTVLRYLLDQETDPTSEIGIQIQHNIDNVILPYMQKLCAHPLEEHPRKLAEIITHNLQQIASRFSVRLSAREFGLTRREIEVSTLIREGLSSKEIADVLGLSDNAVAFHRKNIRRKLGLRSKEENLLDALNTLVNRS